MKKATRSIALRTGKELLKDWLKGRPVMAIADRNKSRSNGVR
jgi:hypothetical protein